MNKNMYLYARISYFTNPKITDHEETFPIFIGGFSCFGGNFVD